MEFIALRDIYVKETDKGIGMGWGKSVTIKKGEKFIMYRKYFYNRPTPPIAAVIIFYEGVFYSYVFLHTLFRVSDIAEPTVSPGEEYCDPICGDPIFKAVVEGQ